MTIPEQVQNDILMHKKVKITVLRTEYYQELAASVRWTSSWAMRTRRGCMPGTASGKLHLRQKAKS